MPRKFDRTLRSLRTVQYFLIFLFSIGVFYYLPNVNDFIVEILIGSINSQVNQLAYWLSLAHWLDSFRFWDEDDYEIFSILSIAYAWTSVILAGKRDSCRHSTTGFGGNKLAILLSGEGLTPFSINNRTNFFMWKKVNWRFLGCLFF